MSDTTTTPAGPRAVLIIGDGLGDWPVASLGGKTPAEAANTPSLDRLAREGITGLMDPIAPGVRAGSDTSHLALLGFDPYHYYPGRGPFEAMGAGLEVKRGDVCFRVNFATVDAAGAVIDRRAGRINCGTAELAKALNGLEHGGCTFYFVPSVEHRAAMLIRGEGLGDKLTDADPHAEGAHPHTAVGADPASQKTADLVNWFVAKSQEILSVHPVNLARIAEGKPPANIALPRGAGLPPHMPTFAEHYGYPGAMVVEVDLLRGIGKYLEMTIVHVNGATGNMASDEMAIAKTAVETLGKFSYVLCNLKCPDVCGHDGDAALKVKAMEKLDRLVGYVLDHTGPDTYIAVTGDHSTPVGAKDHTGEPLPFAMHGRYVRTDDVQQFGERPCAHGGLNRFSGKDVMKMLTSLTLQQEKFGA